MTGDDIVGFYVSEFLSAKDYEMYYKTMQDCLNVGVGVCSFELQDSVFVCAMKRISSKRIKVTEIRVKKI